MPESTHRKRTLEVNGSKDALNLKKKKSRVDPEVEEDLDVEEEEQEDELEDEEEQEDEEDQEEEEEEEDDEEEEKNAKKTSSGRSKARAQCAFDPLNDDVCVAVRAYFEDNSPGTGVTRAATIPAEDGSEIFVGKMLYGLRSRASTSPSPLTTARLNALKDIEAFQDFLKKAVARKSQSSSASNQRIAKIKQKLFETKVKTANAEEQLAECLWTIAKQEVTILKLHDK